MEQTKLKALSGITIAIALMFIAILSSLPLRFLHLSDGWVLFISRLCIWLAFSGIMFYTYKVEKRPLMIWKDKKYSLPVYIFSVFSVLIVLLFSAIMLTMVLRHFNVFEKSKSLEKVMDVFKSNYWLMTFTCITAGITEELVFRAYLMPRIQALVKGPYMAIIGSSIVFGLLHIGYGTVMNVIGPFVIGIVFAIYYYKYRNIRVLILSHFLWDYILLLLKTTQPVNAG